MGLNGFCLDIIVSFLFTIIVLSVVLIIGRLIDMISSFLLGFLSRVFTPSIANIVINRLTFPGTILHELSHAFAIWLTGGKIVKIKLFEFGTPHLGHVEFCIRGSKFKQALQLSLGSCAPVLFGLLYEYILIRIVFLYPLSVLSRCLLWYLIISILVHMSMSKSDLKNYFFGLISVFPTVMLLVLALQYFFR